MDNREQFDNLLSLLYDFPIYCDNEFHTLDTIHIKTGASFFETISHYVSLIVRLFIYITMQLFFWIAEERFVNSEIYDLLSFSDFYSSVFQWILTLYAI